MSDVQSTVTNVGNAASVVTADVSKVNAVAASAVSTAAHDVDVADEAVAGMSSLKKAAIFVGAAIVVFLAVVAVAHHFF